MDLKALIHSDFIDLLAKWNDKLADLAGRMSVDSLVLYIGAGVLAVLVGFAGMHLAKLLCMMGLGGVGYMIGVELFGYLQSNVNALAKWPDFLSYIFGLVIALIFCVFGWKKCLYVMYAAFALLGYHLVTQYLTQNMLLAIGGAILLPMIAAFIMRVAFIALTSAAGGFALVSILSAIWSNVSVLQLGFNNNAIWIAVGAAVVMMIVQLITTRHYSLVKR